MIRELFHPSGGLGYHFRALLRSKRYWKPFRDEIDRFFAPPDFQGKHLVVFGSSGGYLFPKILFSRFKTIDCVDFDPISFSIFRFRHPEWRGRAVRVNFLDEWKHSLGDPLVFLDRLGAPADTAVLFLNVLGQLTNREQLSFFPGMAKLLEGRAWASVHDRLVFDQPVEWREKPAPESISDTLLANALQDSRGQPLAECESSGVGNRFRGERHEYFIWSLRDRQVQVCEAVLSPHS